MKSYTYDSGEEEVSFQVGDLILWFTRNGCKFVEIFLSHDHDIYFNVLQLDLRTLTCSPKLSQIDFDGDLSYYSIKIYRDGQIIQTLRGFND